MIFSTASGTVFESTNRAICQLVDPSNWHSDMAIRSVCDLSSLSPEVALLNERCVVFEPLDTVSVILASFVFDATRRPLWKDGSRGADNGIIDFLAANHRLVQINKMVWTVCPCRDVSKIASDLELVVGFHDIVGVELEDPVEATILVPRPNRSGLG